MSKATRPQPDEAWPGDPGRVPGRARAPKPRRRQFGLRHIMGASVVAGIILAALAAAEKSRETADILIAVFTTAAALTSLGLFMALRLERWNVVGWILAVLAPCGALISVAVSGGGAAVGLGIILVPVLIGTMVHLARRLRAQQQETMLWVLALAADRGRPLGPAVSALKEQAAGRNRVRLRGVAECLEQGLTLPEALDFVPKAAPAPARLLVRVGHDSGALPEALRDAATSRSSRPPGWQALGARVGYLCFVLIVLQGISGFILYFIVPKYEAIFKDFGVALPSVTIAMIETSHVLTANATLPMLTLAEWLVLLYLPFAFAGYGEMKIPIIDRLFLRRHSILILRCLAMVVEAGQPIASGLQTMAVAYPAGWIRERLAGVHLGAEQGHDWIELLRRYRLINRSDQAVLESARRAGNLPWALRELADGGARRLAYRLQAIGQILMTLALLAVGGFVAFSALAYFLPLVRLIESLTR